MSINTLLQNRQHNMQVKSLVVVIVSLIITVGAYYLVTALHWMQGGLVRRKLSVCLSVKRMDCDKTKETSVQIVKPYERSFSQVCWEKEWLVRATPSTRNFGSNRPRLSEMGRFSVDIRS